MKSGKKTGLDRILGHLGELDPTNLTILVNRLAGERRLLETVFHTIRDGIVVTDSTGTMQYANDAAFRLLGLRDREIGKRNLFRRLPELARTLNLSPQRADYSGLSATCEIRLDYPESRIVQVYIVPVEATMGEDDAPGSAVIFSDITEAKLSTEELIENEKIASIMMLAAGVAHELGNPLNSLTIHLQLLKRQLEKVEASPQTEKALRSVQICSAEVTRLDQIITHFLGAVRPQTPDFREVRLLDILNEVLEVEEGHFQSKQIEVTVDLEGYLPPVEADPALVKQVFFNILKNAIEAMAGGGTLRIRTRRNRQSAFLDFADSGRGIDAEDLSKVFQPYFTTKTEGTGLGMMIAQRIMRDHGGQIAIDSQAGKGTVVTLQFPVKHPTIPQIESH